VADKDTRVVADNFGAEYVIVGSDRLADYLSRGFHEVGAPAPAPVAKAPARK
jgi:hypothetical protein